MSSAVVNAADALTIVRQYLLCPRMVAHSGDLDRFTDDHYAGYTRQSEIATWAQHIDGMLATAPYPHIYNANDGDYWHGGSRVFEYRAKQIRAAFIDKSPELRAIIVRDTLAFISPGAFFDTVVDTLDALDLYLSNPYNLLTILGE